MKCLSLKVFCSTLLVAAAVVAQTTTVRVSPDCLFTGTVTGSGSTVVTANGNGDNRSIGCSSWVVVWEITGGGSPTTTVQSAVTSGGLPVSWQTFAGTVLVGSNPSTATVGTVALIGYVPWIRVTVANGGTLNVRMFGYRNSSGGGGGGGGGSVSVSNFPNPQNVLVTNVCEGTSVTSLPVTFTALNGAQILRAAALNQRIYVCGFQAAWDNAADVKLIQGSGVGCATGSGDLTGFFKNLVNASIAGVLQTAQTSGLCLVSSGSITGGGVLRYVQQ